jgi:Cu/Ag efflux pump CusA
VVEIQVNLDAAAALGVKPGDVRRSAAALLAGIEVGNLFEEQKIFEVVVWGEPQVRHSVESIHDMLVDAPGGRHVRLGDLATVRIVPAVNVIHRENVARIVDVVAGVSGRSVNAVNADVTRMIRGTAFPLEYRAELVGDYTKQQQGRGRVIAAAIAVAIGIVFIYQASVGSWALALGLLLALPVALAGSAIAAAATGATLSLGSMAGLLTVAGLAVRHGVLLVNRYRDLKRDGMDGAALVIEGTRERAPAILMSTLVTAAAVLPFAVFGARAGLEVLGPMAVVILGGLVTVSLHSLCIVPWLYARIGASIRHEAMDDDGLDFVGEPEPQPLS